MGSVMATAAAVATAMAAAAAGAGAGAAAAAGRGAGGGGGGPPWNSTVPGCRNHACAAENVHGDRRLLLQLTRMARGGELAQQTAPQRAAQGANTGCAAGKAGRQQSTTAKGDSAAEHRRLLRRLTRTIRAGEAPQQTAGSGVAYAAHTHGRRSSRRETVTCVGAWGRVKRGGDFFITFSEEFCQSVGSRVHACSRSRTLTNERRTKRNDTRAAYAYEGA